MPRRLGTTFGLCASAGALAALVLATVPGSDAAPPRTSSATVATSAAALTGGSSASTVAFVNPKKAKTKTPIKHVVVIFDENISYDHYFGTYPKATNKGGGTKFKAKKDTPKNDNLVTSKKLKKNPNLYKPFRLGPSEALTCDQNHGYTAEQKAFNNSAPWTGSSRKSASTPAGACSARRDCTAWATTTATRSTGLWNYAQNFGDVRPRSFSGQLRAVSPEALNLIAGGDPWLR